MVSHQILLDLLYYLGSDIEYWDIIKDLFDGITSTVKWQGDTSLSFSIDQEVRQGEFCPLTYINSTSMKYFQNWKNITWEYQQEIHIQAA